MWSTSGAGWICVFRVPDNGRVRFYDLGLPDVIKIKRRFFEESGLYPLTTGLWLDVAALADV